MRGVRPWRSILFRVLMSAAGGMLAVLTGGLLLAWLILRMELPSARLLRVSAGFLWAAGAMLAGRSCGRHGRRRGALEGILCGGILFLFRIGGAILLHEAPRSLLLYTVLLPAAGALGGILGVNTRLRKPPN